MQKRPLHHHFWGFAERPSRQKPCRTSLTETLGPVRWSKRMPYIGSPLDGRSAPGLTWSEERRGKVQMARSIQPSTRFRAQLLRCSQDMFSPFGGALPFFS